MRILNKIHSNNGNIVDFKEFSLEYYNFKSKGKENFFEIVKNNINKIVAVNQTQVDLKIDLENDFEKIVRAIPEQIPDIIQKYTTGVYSNMLHHHTDGITTFGKAVLDTFKYKNFRKNSKASMFCEGLKIKACLYCNAQFTLAIGKAGKSKKLLFQLDHFYNKNKYPFLSLTIGNLIPCCSTCNISKSKIDFDIVDYIHPYIEDLSSKFVFFIDEEDTLDYLINDRNENKLKPQIKVFDKRINAHFKIFDIEHIYNKHTDIVEELILKSLYYNNTKREELKEFFSELKITESILDRFILGNYTLDSEINNRPLSKLSKDIGKQLKIIK